MKKYDWTRTQTVTLPNSANCGLLKIECESAPNDDGPAGLMLGIKYKNQYVSSNAETIDPDNGIITLLDSSKELVVSSQTSTTWLSGDPFNAEWIGRVERMEIGQSVAMELSMCFKSIYAV
eukprot:TRINITY_DN9145_c0_g1_i1.p1 TRINITY_DN9145_c0_g1~~TRINITY_DN9145_c0_g1_i1.p1  ORF type:complete len:121 (+),score=13.36 TRINITY_DN9145_c0_g1_i1:419-781(+)